MRITAAARENIKRLIRGYLITMSKSNPSDWILGEQIIKYLLVNGYDINEKDKRTLRKLFAEIEIEENSKFDPETGKPAMEHYFGSSQHGFKVILTREEADISLDHVFKHFKASAFRYGKQKKAIQHLYPHEWYETELGKIADPLPDISDFLESIKDKGLNYESK